MIPTLSVHFPASKEQIVIGRQRACRSTLNLHPRSATESSNREEEPSVLLLRRTPAVEYVLRASLNAAGRTLLVVHDSSRPLPWRLGETSVYLYK